MRFIRIFVAILKKNIYIAMFFGLASVTSCQKDEFKDIVTSQVNSNESLQITSDGEIIENGIFDSEEDVIVTPSFSESELSPWEKEIIEINIKEVSDGDDEADDGDDSKTD